MNNKKMTEYLLSIGKTKETIEMYKNRGMLMDFYTKSKERNNTTNKEIEDLLRELKTLEDTLDNLHVGNEDDLEFESELKADISELESKLEKLGFYVYW